MTVKSAVVILTTALRVMFSSAQREDTIDRSLYVTAQVNSFDSVGGNKMPLFNISSSHLVEENSISFFSTAAKRMHNQSEMEIFHRPQSRPTNLSLSQLSLYFHSTVKALRTNNQAFPRLPSLTEQVRSTDRGIIPFEQSIVTDIGIVKGAITGGIADGRIQITIIRTVEPLTSVDDPDGPFRS